MCIDVLRSVVLIGSTQNTKGVLKINIFESRCVYIISGAYKLLIIYRCTECCMYSLVVLVECLGSSMTLLMEGA